MDPEQKFKIPRPSPKLLKTLGELLDSIENSINNGDPYQANLKSLNETLSLPVDEYEICSYYGASTRDEFLRVRLMPDPHQFKEVNESELLWLISQILENVTDDALVFFYSRIVEINMSCPDGTLSDLIFQDGVEDPQEILEKLKETKSKVILL